MKTKFIMLLAAMLLGASAFAQSENNEPLKGDVNGDGKVDVADINEIIKIMKDAGGTAEETVYYWYVGTTEPTASNLASIKTGSESSKPTTWTSSNPHSIAATNNTDSSSYIYYCFPTSWNVIVLDSDKVSEVQLANVSTFTLNGINYTINRTGRKISSGTTKEYYAKVNE